MVPHWVALVSSRIVAASTTSPCVEGIIAVAQGLAGLGAITAISIKTGTTTDFILSPWETETTTPSLLRTALTFGRVLIVHSLMEEIVWRVALLPHPVVDGVKCAPLWLGLGANVGFALYHVVGGHLLYYTGRPGALDVFQNPSFLFLAFCLGGACTFAYYASGGALYAPVLVHAIPVTLWLTYFRGEDVLMNDCLSKVERE